MARSRKQHGILNNQLPFLSGLLLLAIVAITIASIFLFKNISTTDNRSQAAALQESFVTRQGSQFYLANQEFKFVGFNLFDAMGSGNSPYSCLQTNGWWTKFSDEEIDTAMKTMKVETGATVLRFWAFQKYTKDGSDFSGLDKVIRLAKQNGFKVMPVLEDGPGYCTEPGGGGNNRQEKWKYNNDTWYTEGYKVPNAPYKLSYRDYVQKIVAQYRNEPAIFGWMLMNEADTSKRITTADGKQQSALVPFTQDMASLVKKIDPNHLVTVGTQSNGASGATGQDFIDVYSLENVDYAEAHDWGYWGNDNEAIPGGNKNADGSMSLPNPLSADCLKTYQAKIGCSMAQAELVVKKPFVMGEVGIAAKDVASRAKRAQLIDAKMKAFFENGGDGYLYWQWNKVLDSQQYDVLPATNDPLLAAMKKYAGLSLAAVSTPLPSSSIVPTSVPTALPTVLPTSKPTATPVATPRPSIIPVPSSTPRPSFTPVPSIKPTIKPSVVPTTKPTSVPVPTKVPTPTPSPSLVPVPVPAVSVLPGEAMNGEAGKFSIITDLSARGQKAVQMTKNGTLKGTIIGPISKITLRAKPQLCLGAPHILIKVNGNFVWDGNVNKAEYNEYVTNDLKYLNLKNQTYPIEIIYNNDATFMFCDRNVIIDQIELR